MGKKDKPAATVPVGGTPQLTHSPFAGLAGQSGAKPPAAVSGERGKEPETPKRGRDRLVLRRETKHRGGKAVIVISGFAALPAFDAAAIENLAKDCRRKLGCGGSVDDGEILLQGDRASEVAELLRALGFRVDGVTK